MTDTDGLSLEQVRSQWQESQRLLDEVRVRLEQVAAAKESSHRSAASLAESEQSLRSLVDLHTGAVTAVRDAQATAVAALDSMTQAAAAAQPGQLVELAQKSVDQMAVIAREQGAMASGQADLATAVSAISQRVQGIEKALAELQATVSRATASTELIATVTAERDKARLDLQTVLGALPGRFKSKAETALLS